MKMIGYEENLKVVCPVCGKTILDDAKEIHSPQPCKHLMLWINSSDDYDFAFAHKSLRKEAKENAGETVKTFRRIAKRDNLATYKYDGGLSCGCSCRPIYDLVAFKKA